MKADLGKFNAFITAAGLGKRLRPYTDHMPKPMVPVGGRAIIDMTLDHLRRADVPKVTINVHYMADILTSHLADIHTPEITFSHETEILDTGLGIKNALSTMEDRPFFVMHGDTMWTDGPHKSALVRLAETFDPEKMDILLLLQPLERMHLTSATGDYHLQADGQITRALDQSGMYAFTGVRITSPKVFDNTPDTPFSFLKCMDKAQDRGRLFGLVHDGEWHHISTPQDLERVNAAIADQNKKAGHG